MKKLIIAASAITILLSGCATMSGVGTKVDFDTCTNYSIDIDTLASNDEVTLNTKTGMLSMDMLPLFSDDINFNLRNVRTIDMTMTYMDRTCTIVKNYRKTMYYPNTIMTFPYADNTLVTWKGTITWRD